MKPQITRLSFVLGVLALGTSVFAHAFLDHSDPKVGSTIGKSPAAVSIWFTQQPEPAFSKIALADTSGKAAVSAESQVDKDDAKVMHLPLPQLSAGRYAVHWTAVATDGHRTQGDFAFIVK